MLLTIDVGNTNIGFGLFRGRDLAHQFRCESARQRTADEYAVLVRQMLALREVDPKDVHAAIVATELLKKRSLPTQSALSSSTV